MPKLVPDKLIEALVPDPSQLKHLTRRVGWVGKSTREGFARLYLNLNLNSYLEFRESDVVHVVPLPAEEGRRFGGTALFFERDAELTHVRTTPQEASSQWLGGDIMRSVWGRGVGGPGSFAPTPLGPQELNPTWVFTVIAILVFTSVARCGEGGTDFTLTGDTLCTGSPGSC